jgi:DNA invertase Pin-like site-specific DNA recombinase
MATGRHAGKIRNGNRAAVYTRISRDAEGLALGVERQREDLEEFARRRGLEIVELYEDNDIGASTRSSKPRPDYMRMLRDAASDRFDAIVAYTSSRLTRRPRENEDLIELAEQYGIRFQYRNSPSFDLNTADGRNVARILAANDAAESERIGERVAREARQRAENGQWHGGWAPLGYQFTYDTGDPPRVTGLEPDPVRAPIIAEMARRVIDGESLYALCRELNRRGVLTAPGAKAKQGTMWRSQTLKRALINPAVLGMREHDGELREGKWLAILDRETWERARDVLLDPARRNPDRSWVADVSRKRALSGLLVCGGTRTEGPDAGKVCRATLVSQPWGRGEAKVPTMICQPTATGGCGHLRIKYEPVERWVTRLLIARLDSDEMRAALAADDTDTSVDEVKLRRDIAVDQRALRNLEDERDDNPSLPKASYRRRYERIADRIEANRRRLAGLAGRRAAAGVTSGADLAERLAGATVEQQRALLSMFIDRVVIKPQPHGVPTHVNKRKTETPEAHAARLADLRESTLAQRVEIHWRPLP